MKSARTMRWLMQQGGRSAYDPLLIPNLLFFNSYKTAVQVAPQVKDASSSSARNITNPSGATFRCSNTPGVDFVPYQGATLTLENYVNPGNNGAFTAIGSSSAATDYLNPTAALETVGVGVGPQIARLTGYCNSHPDLLAGYVFSQANIAQCPAVNTNVVPGKQVLGIVGALTRHLAINSAPLAGALNGTGAFTLLSYMRPLAVNVSATSSRWMAFQDAAGTSRILVGYGAATAHILQIVDAAGASGNISVTLSTPLALNVWQLLAVVYSAGTATWYLNGVAVGSGSGTVRTRASLVNTFLGYRANYPGGSGGTQGHRAVDAAVARAMTPAELLELTAFCQGDYA
jgi:hypothetical protein